RKATCRGARSARPRARCGRWCRGKRPAPRRAGARARAASRVRESLRTITPAANTAHDLAHRRARADSRQQLVLLFGKHRNLSLRIAQVSKVDAAKISL